MKNFKLLIILTTIIFACVSCVSNSFNSDENLPLDKFIIGRWISKEQNDGALPGLNTPRHDYQFINSEMVITVRISSDDDFYNSVLWQYKFIDESKLRLSNPRLTMFWEIQRDGDQLVIQLFDERRVVLERVSNIWYCILATLTTALLIGTFYIKLKPIDYERIETKKTNIFILLKVILRSIILFGLVFAIFNELVVIYFRFPILQPLQSLIWFEINITVMIFAIKITRTYRIKPSQFLRGGEKFFMGLLLFCLGLLGTMGFGVLRVLIWFPNWGCC